jgi:hypothetical protein
MFKFCAHELFLNRDPFYAFASKRYVWSQVGTVILENE